LVALTEEGIAPEDLLKENYIVMLNTKDKIKEVFDIILQAQDGVILFNCNAGKDRTGLIAMLILGLAGVADQDIVSNYEISFTNIYHEFTDEVASDSKHILSSDPENIIKAIRYIYDEYGSFEVYFKWLGFSAKEITALKKRIVSK
jgi:protein-tyrosine phosphatase